MSMPRPATCRSAPHHVFQIAFAGDEHVPRRVRDREFRFGRHHRGLRGHAARPEHRHIARLQHGGIAIVGMHDVVDADRGQVAHTYGGTVHGRVIAGNPACVGHLRRRNATHRHDHRRMERAGRTALDRRVVHRHVAACRDVPHRHARLHQRKLECETAANHKRDQIGSPILANIGHFGYQFATLPHAVQRHVGTDVGARRGDGCGDARLHHFQQRTRFGIALREQQKIECLLLGQNHQIRLRVALRNAAGRADQAVTERGARLFGRARRAKFGCSHIGHPIHHCAHLSRRPPSGLFRTNCRRTPKSDSAETDVQSRFPSPWSPNVTGAARFMTRMFPHCKLAVPSGNKPWLGWTPKTHANADATQQRNSNKAAIKRRGARKRGSHEFDRSGSR